MKKFSFVDTQIVIRIPKELKNMLQDRAVARNHSLSMEVRDILLGKLYENLKHEDKIKKRFDEFESRLFGKITEEFDKSRAGVLKTNLYSITNFHLLKHIVANQELLPLDISKVAAKKAHFVSAAKVQTLQHEFDSINSKERFDENIKKEHLHK